MWSTLIKPVRIQRSRQKGSRLLSPNGLPVSCVTRPGKWGNPFKIGALDEPTGRVIDGPMAVRLFRGMMTQTAWPQLRQRARDELGGRNLACFCALDHPCHADVLLIIANSTEDEINDPDSQPWEAVYAVAEQSRMP